MKRLALLLTLAACQPADVNPALVGTPDPTEPTRLIARPTFCLPDGDYNATLGDSAFVSDSRYSLTYLRVLIEDRLAEQGISEYDEVIDTQAGRLGVLVTVPTHDPGSCN